jgi:hypothetical protein
MPSNFSSIGVNVNSSKELAQLLSKLAETSKTVKCQHGYYINCHSDTGAELWAQMDNTNQCIGVNPCYDGVSNLTAGITKKIGNESYNDFEAELYCWMNPSKDKIDMGDYPFIFDCVNVAAFDKIQIPCRANIKLTAIAHQLEIYADEKTYSASKKDGKGMAAKSFIPSGTFPLDDNDKDFEYKPEVIFSGIILEYKLLTNEWGNGKYYWLKVETYGGIIDVVIDPEMVDKPIKVGGVISGVFYLCGKLL